MSKKDKGKKGEGKWNAEDVIQAVVIADSFNFRFLPITMEKPRALLPLVNRPLIDYTVEFLAVSGVDEIFVFCCAHSEMIKRHLESSRWMAPTSPIKLRIIISEDCPSVGDALRNIDSQSLIQSDFVLVSGDLVANMELKEMIECHKEMRKKDKMSVMTCIYKRAKPGHPTRSKEDDILIARDAKDGRLLYCSKPSGQKMVSIPVSVIEENPELELHYDVLDCHVSICAPSVPQLFSDNFDYQTRHHFIRGILSNEEITGNHIYTHFISDQYAARVSNLCTYDAISKDVLHRWVYPLVPDNATGDSYSYGRHNIYLHSNVTLAMGSVLHEDVAVGGQTKVGRDSHISNSAIGHSCEIGERVAIRGSYVWDKVRIESGCTLNQAIVCDGCVLKSNVTLEPGCILSFGVVIGPDVTVKAGSRITTKHQSDSNAYLNRNWEEEEESEDTVTTPTIPEPDPALVGEDGNGFLWQPPESDDEADSDHLVVENWPDRDGAQSSAESSVSSSRSSSPDVECDTEVVMFYNEILDSIRSGVAELVPVENTILMINASKHAYNIPIQDVPTAVVKAIVEGPPNSATGKPAELLAYVETAIKHFETLLQHYIKDESLQTSVLSMLVDCAGQHPNLLTIFGKVVLTLYNHDVLEEAAILEIFESLDSESCTLISGQKRQKLVASLKPIVEWLNTAEEESSEEGED